MLPFQGACLVLGKSTKALPLLEIVCPFRAAPKNYDKTKTQYIRFTLWNSFQIPQGKQNYKHMKHS